jgi:hypothetical protein
VARSSANATVEHLTGGGGRLVPQSFKTVLPSTIESPIISPGTLAPNQRDAKENSWPVLTAFNVRSLVNSSWQSSNERRIRFDITGMFNANLKKSGYPKDTELRALRRIRVGSAWFNPSKGLNELFTQARKLPKPGGSNSPETNKPNPNSSADYSYFTPTALNVCRCVEAIDVIWRSGSGEVSGG